MTSSMRTNLTAGAAALIVMLLAAIALSGAFDGSGDAEFADTSSSTSLIATLPDATVLPATSVPPDTVAETTVVEVDPDLRFSDLLIIEPADLPIEAVDTLLLIADGGPYPYRQDDEIFQNREGILPDRPNGHYREYTVETPGSEDRGARRIVAGADGELYYTDDHYDSFREIIS